MLIPMIFGDNCNAISSSDLSWTSTITSMPSLVASECNESNSSAVSMDTIKRMQSALLALDS